MPCGTSQTAAGQVCEAGSAPTRTRSAAEAELSVGKSVKMFLADGTPGGLLTTEIMNWTGHIVAAPRSDLAQLLERPEASRTGVYLLIGDDPDSLGGAKAYTGEGDDIGKRLVQHAKLEAQGGKDFWERAVILTSKDANMTKAHARYLESKLITLAKHAKRATLTNSTEPPLPALPEADVSDMEYYIAQTKIVLPVLGVNIFRATTPKPPGPPNGGETVSVQASPVFELHLKKEDIIARAQEIDGEFTVLAASQARHSWTGVEVHGYTALRQKLEKDGTLVAAESGVSMRFAYDHVFPSPSAAAAVVAGRSANGRNEWKRPGSGLTYGAWQNQGVEQFALEPGV
jgi:Domain of unknown function (DUF4357)